MDRAAWQATHGVTEVRHDLATKQQPSTTFQDAQIDHLKGKTISCFPVLLTQWEVLPSRKQWEETCPPPSCCLPFLTKLARLGRDQNMAPASRGRHGPHTPSPPQQGKFCPKAGSAAVWVLVLWLWTTTTQEGGVGSPCGPHFFKLPLQAIELVFENLTCGQL